MNVALRNLACLVLLSNPLVACVEIETAANQADEATESTPPTPPPVTPVTPEPEIITVKPENTKLGWSNLDLPVDALARRFVVRFRARVEQAPTDAVFALSPSGVVGAVADSSPSALANYQALAVIVRMNTSGKIDARNAAKYQSAASLAYQANRDQLVEITVDLDRRSFDARVSSEGSSPSHTIATEYAFRSEQSTATQLRKLSFYSTLGNAAVRDLQIEVLPALQTPVVDTPVITEPVIQTPVIEIPQVVGAGCFCGSVDPARPCTAKVLEIPYIVSGQTKKVAFEFAETVRCGEFASSGRHGLVQGSRFWVAPLSNNGAVKIIRSFPEVKGAGETLRNGMMTEYSSQQANLHFTGGKRGFGATYAFHLNQTVNTSSLAKNNLGLGSLTILKSVSHPINAEIPNNQDPGLKCSNSNRNCEEFVAPLVIVSQPPGNVFAPAFFGPDRSMIARSNFRADLLPNLSSGAGLMTFQEAHQTLAYVRASEGLYDLNIRESHGAQVNINSRGYEGYRNQKLWGAMMRLMIRPANSEEAALKHEMGLFIAQHAIDLYAVHKHGKGTPNGLCGAWIGNGGFGYSRLGLIVLGSTLIEKKDWLLALNDVLATPAGRHCFGETTNISPPNSLGRNVPLFGAISSVAYNIGSKNKTAGDPAGWIDGGGNTSAGLTLRSGGVVTGQVGPYHDCCTMGTFITQAMVVMAIPEAFAAWPKNARYYFDFVDRSYRGEGSRAYAYLDSRTQATYPFTIGGYVPDGMAQFYNNYYNCMKTGSCAGQ
jgi:hypothetical protein